MLLKMSNDKITTALEGLEKKAPQLVVSRIKKGTILRRGSDQYYEIDDPNIDLTLGNYTGGQIPLERIYHSTDPDLEKLNELFNNGQIIPFSEAVKRGLGACLEKSILTQLAAQRGRKSWLVNGFMGVEQDGIVPLFHHTYNVIFKDGSPYLVDSQNPAHVNPFLAYTVPVLDIDEKGDVQISKGSELKRVYTIK